MSRTTKDSDVASTDELLLQFAEVAKIAGTASTPYRGIPKRTPERDRLVQELQRLGEQIRKRKPISRVRELLEHENLDVRGWAAAQFHSLDPERASASFNGLLAKLSTAEVLALTRRARQAPPSSPSITAMSSPALVERFEDAAMREYATRFLNCIDEPADMALRNDIVSKVFDIMRELKSRGQLALLIPLLESANVTVRREAAIACLKVEPDRATAALEWIALNGDQLEPVKAKETLERWRRGAGIVYGVV